MTDSANASKDLKERRAKEVIFLFHNYSSLFPFAQPLVIVIIMARVLLQRLCMKLTPRE